MDERRHVHELDGDAWRHRRGVVGGGRQEREGGAQALSACGERGGPDLGHQARVALDRTLKLFLDLGEVVVEASGRADDLEGGHGFTPTWSATMPPPRSR